jgi:hypothetical protein
VPPRSLLRYPNGLRLQAVVRALLHHTDRARHLMDAIAGSTAFSVVSLQVWLCADETGVG